MEAACTCTCGGWFPNARAFRYHVGSMTGRGYGHEHILVAQPGGRIPPAAAAMQSSVATGSFGGGSSETGDGAFDAMVEVSGFASGDEMDDPVLDEERASQHSEEVRLAHFISFLSRVRCRDPCSIMLSARASSRQSMSPGPPNARAPSDERADGVDSDAPSQGLSALLRLFYQAGVTRRFWAEFVALVHREDVRRELPFLRSRLSYYDRLLDAAPAEQNAATWSFDSATGVRHIALALVTCDVAKTDTASCSRRRFITVTCAALPP